VELTKVPKVGEEGEKIGGSKEKMEHPCAANKTAGRQLRPTV
jgi:hypothetical protein